MMNVQSNAIWQLIYQSDKVTWFVLLTLLMLSVFCWSILFYKKIIWKKKKTKIAVALSQIKSAKTFEDILALASRNSNTIVGIYLAKNLSFLKSVFESKANPTMQLSQIDFNFLEQISNSTLDELISQEEELIPITSVSAAVSPLLGLFGTIWGLVHSFVEISKKQSADIATVAPGIAEALITTLAGLIVAIPALIIYYYLKLQVAQIEQSLVTFSERFLFVVQNVFVMSVPDANFQIKNTLHTMEQNNA